MPMILSCQSMSNRVPSPRIARIALSALMTLFAAVQYNDPDGLAWAALYAVPASCMAVAAFRPAWLAGTAGRVSLGVALVVLSVVCLSVWPEQGGFWRREVWWEVESAREGMGAAVALLVTALGVPVARRGRGVDAGRVEASGTDSAPRPT